MLADVVIILWLQVLLLVLLLHLANVLLALMARLTYVVIALQEKLPIFDSIIIILLKEARLATMLDILMVLLLLCYLVWGLSAASIEG